MRVEGLEGPPARTDPQLASQRDGTGRSEARHGDRAQNARKLFLPEMRQRALVEPVMALALGDDHAIFHHPLQYLALRSARGRDRDRACRGKCPGGAQFLDDARLRAGDEATMAAMEAVNASGEAYLSHTSVEGRAAIRFAVGSWRTTLADVERTWRALQDAASAHR